MNHQTKVGILEKAVPIANSNKVKLLGSEALLEHAKYSNSNITENISENHEKGTYIFYFLENHTENDIIGYEKGVGKLIKEENDYFIDRVFPFVYGTDIENLQTASRPAEFSTSPNTFLVIGTIGPSNILEALFLPHAVVSTSSNSIQTTQLSDNTVIGRLTGNVEALDQTKLGQLLSGASLNLLRLAPSTRPQNPLPGSIILNQETNDLEIFKEGSWRLIA